MSFFGRLFRSDSAQLVPREQLAQARKKLQKQNKERKRKAVEYINKADYLWSKCRNRGPSYNDVFKGYQPSDFQCNKLYYLDLKKESPQEVIRIYQKYLQQLKNPQQHKKRQQQSKKRAQQSYASATQQYAKKQQQRKRQQ